MLPPVTTAGTTLETRVLDWTSTLPIENVDVSICRFADPACDTYLAHGLSDSNGFVTLHVPASPPGNAIDVLGSDSFAQLGSPASPAYVPGLYFLGYPVSEPLAPIAEPYALLLSVESSASFFAPETWDMSTGWIQAQVFDCHGIAAPDVQLKIEPSDPAVLAFFYEGAAGPSFTATATTAAGAGYGGGFLNVPVSATGTTVTITATPLALHKPSSQAHVLVRAGTLTDVFMFPNQ